MSAIDGAIKKTHGSGTTTLAISNEEMNDIMKIVQALEDSNILLKGVNKTIKNEIKEQKEEALGLLLGTLGASLLGNLLTGRGFARAGKATAREVKGFIRTGKGTTRTGRGLLRAGERTIRAGERFLRAGKGI